MLHVILLILKIIGIILAVLLGIILLVLLTVLLVPIRYRAFISKRDELKADARITWLLHILSVPIVFQDGVLSVKLKLFGITIKDLMENEDELAKDAGDFFQDAEEEADKAEENLLKQDPPVETALAPPQTQEPEKQKPEGRKPSEPDSPKQQEQYEQTSGTPAKKTILSKIKSIWNRIFSILKKIRNLKYTFRRFCVKIKRMGKKLRDTKDFLTDERTKDAVHLCLSQVKILLGRLLPKKVRGEVHFGTEDPALTGQILGGISIFYPFFMDNVKVLPDFEQSCLDGELFVKGRLRLATVALIAIRLLKNKNIRYVYRKLSQ